MTKIFDFLDSLDPNLGAVYSANNLVLMTDKEYSNRLEQIRTLTTENRRLQQKVNQLETNIDEAIKYINNSWTGGYIDKTLKYKVEEINITKLLSLLERGKE